MADFTWTAPTGMQAVTSTALTVSNAADLTAIKEVAAGATGTKTATSDYSAAPTGYLSVSLVIRPSADAPPSPDPSPDPDPGGGVDYRYAQIDDSPWLAIAAIDPASATDNPAGDGYDGYRGPNQLILYTDDYGAATDTNRWGTEVPFGADLIVDSVNDRQAAEDDTGTSIPAGGYVLSGHGTARDWLNTWASASATVTLATEANPGPTPGGGGASSGYPAKSVDVYKKLWSSNSAVTNVPSTATGIRLAFAQGNPPALVDYTTTGQASMVASLATRRTAGQKIIASIGGMGGAINTGARASFVAGIAAIKTVLEGSAGGGLDGIDWDIEASSLIQADVVWISQQLKLTYGNNFAITMAPNGVNVAQYLPCAVALHNAGILDHYAQQFYDASVSLAAAKGRIQEAIGAGLPQSVIGVGMMTTANGNGDATHWSLAQCRTYMADIRATWPGITKCYIWTEDDHLTAGTISTWVSDMRSIIGV